MNLSCHSYERLSEDLNLVRAGGVTLSNFVQDTIEGGITLEMISDEARSYFSDLIEYDIYIKLLSEVFEQSLDSLPRDLSSLSKLYSKLDEYFENYRVNKESYPDMVSVLPPLEFKKMVDG